jgi:ribosome maturation factor RimP
VSAQSDRAQDVVRPAVEAAGYDLEDLTVTAAGRRSVVRVVVDSDTGVDLDLVAELSRALGAALDATDVMGEQPYVLEVTSPGVDRPLREPRHWRRAAGRLVATSVDGEPVTARVVGADDDGVTVVVDGEQRLLPYPGLGPGAVQVEFTRAESP